MTQTTRLEAIYDPSGNPVMETRITPRRTELHGMQGFKTKVLTPSWSIFVFGFSLGFGVDSLLGFDGWDVGFMVGGFMALSAFFYSRNCYYWETVDYDHVPARVEVVEESEDESDPQPPRAFTANDKGGSRQVSLEFRPYRFTGGEIGSDAVGAIVAKVSGDPKMQISRKVTGLDSDSYIAFCDYAVSKGHMAGFERGSNWRYLTKDGFDYLNRR